MTHRPYPNADRARRQRARHDDETPPGNIPPREPLTTAVAFERWAAAMRAAVPTAEQLLGAWADALKKRPVGSEEKTG